MALNQEAPFYFPRGRIELPRLIAEHPIGTLTPCGTSIVALPAEF